VVVGRPPTVVYKVTKTGKLRWLEKYTMKCSYFPQKNLKKDREECA
jgi:hypothetical protein